MTLTCVCVCETLARVCVTLVQGVCVCVTPGVCVCETLTQVCVCNTRLGVCARACVTHSPALLCAHQHHQGPQGRSLSLCQCPRQPLTHWRSPAATPW